MSKQINQSSGENGRRNNINNSTVDDDQERASK